ncbi:uncharacterized protein LOC133289151 [Gastrolobium bilobum]|uniref:uncharacterized protein LOC133289151 n=1 Tax=Gastrolobium bilobum TaxID=150636 RepID=UPI002AB2041A|nr:uncharacterized protein LOC133289151 [Gastrolobium bilobum]
MEKMENESIAAQPKRGVLQLEGNDDMLAEQKLLSQQVAILNKKFEKLHPSSDQAKSISCEYYKGKHETNECNKNVELNEEEEQEKEVETPTSKEESVQKDKGKAKEQTSEAPKKQWDFSRFEKPPYPMKLKQQAQKQQYARFLDMFKKLQINISFVEDLVNMPNYAKFMKDLLSRKHKLQECGTVALTEECSAIIQKKFLPKLRDPGSFNIPSAIDNINVGWALCDLGAGINLMPLSVMKSLGISELKPTMVSL